ncbi:DEAD/DEAH box helicase family protein [Treponema sp. HNW]|uniref:type III restriction-modification system endonuclease n=1 Tax=Treponema sp. HNW TaxID=3116654 RepID=UPI003D0C4665
MKFAFKIQSYQTDAVNAVVDVFKGQPYGTGFAYIRDTGIQNTAQDVGSQYDFKTEEKSFQAAGDDPVGYKNADIQLDEETLLNNIREVQRRHNIRCSSSLIKSQGAYAFDIEMETGTGKTYVYIKTVFELHKRFGWSKFIIVVPSIAIREGVKKSFEITQEHFMELYGKKARFFIYNSAHLNDIDRFSSDSGINVMIINTQAFAASLKEDGKSKESRIIYSERDEFASRRPIDVIKANNPILILDEPQKMEGEATQKALAGFNPLFLLHYSATHTTSHNVVYRLDALDAFNKRLVKKIEVKGFEVQNLQGTHGYLFFETLLLAPDKPPRARVEIETAQKNGTARKVVIVSVGDDLFYKSKEMEQYKNGFTVSEIDPVSGTLGFTNGFIIKQGDVIGDAAEENMRRVQIRETVISHFEKEEQLFKKGIKTLSLFFIDEVSKYRSYDEAGTPVPGEYAAIFEEEYKAILNNRLETVDADYQAYLKTFCSDIGSVHNGYFSIDGKSGRAVNSTVKRGSDSSDDIRAYDLILKDKERLLAFEEPVRFIFSHSALREGWDNPNVFQICTLNRSQSTTKKRQEVGRGLRLCVNQAGSRMDAESCGEAVFDINKLTVVANESYTDFVSGLQKEIAETLYERPSVITEAFFEGKSIEHNGSRYIIDKHTAKKIERYLIKNDYIDEDGKITDLYRDAVSAGTISNMPEDLQYLHEGVHLLLRSVFDEKIFNAMIENGNQPKIEKNELNDNFKKAEFQALWNEINHKYAYKVSFDSRELIEKAVSAIDKNLAVSELTYVATTGEQKDIMDAEAINLGTSFSYAQTKTEAIKTSGISQVKYDLIGKIAAPTKLKRRTAAEILSGIQNRKFNMFKANPEEFIQKIIKIINEQKAAMIVEHISYNRIKGYYESSIFTQEKKSEFYAKAFPAKKAIQNWIFTDGTAEYSVERTFAEALDTADEVSVYAKLPRSFYIPTPVGNYSPDWAIAFYKGKVKHIFFIAETKGSMDSMELRPIEQAKITCAKKLFNEISGGKVRYHEVNNYGTLLEVMKTID